MSKQKAIIEIEPPDPFVRTEGPMMFRNFLCPHCHGRGGFTEETGRDEYRTKTCIHCDGTGLLKARIAVSWEPDYDS